MDGGDGRRVLCVDGDEEHLATVRQALESGGFVVATATAAEGALDRLADGDVDCVVAGDALDDGGGLELLSAVRDERPGLPVVLHPADGSEALAGEAIAAGVTDYVPRADDAQLAERVTAAVERERSPTGASREQVLAALHDAATDIERCDTVAAVCERTVAAAENILEFDVCGVSIEEDGMLPMTAASTELDDEAAVAMPVDEGLIGKTYRTGEATVFERLSSVPEASPRGAFTDVSSGMVVPVGDYGVFTAVAERKGAFDERDRELAELLVAHAAEALRRIESAADLREERDRLAALFESVPEPVVHVRETGEGPVVANANTAFEETFGRGEGGVVGAPLGELVGIDDPSAVDDELASLADEEGSITREVRRRTADGERAFHVRVTHLDPVADVDEREAIGVYVDITDQKRRIAELERQNERLDRFAGIVSHDLRSPLNVAAGNVGLAAEECDSDYLGLAEAALDRMDAMVDDVLELARQGRRVADPEPVALADAVDAAWESVDAAGATLRTDDPPTVRGDPERIRALLENLLRNAVDHAGPAVTVEVGALADDRGFYVADDGPGISADDRDRVFEHGYTTHEDGTGFGLAIVDEIAEAHGWTVALTESGAGGARFEFGVGG